MKKGIGLLSGGLDSAVSLALAQQRGVRILLALTFDYGQKAVRPEIKAGRQMAGFLEIPHRVIRLDWFRDLAESSALTTRRRRVPAVSLAELKQSAVLKHSAQAVWVPNRNGLFINIAATWAEALGADYIITGFNREEAATFPDNSAEFIRAGNQSLRWSTRTGVKVVSYTIKMNKTQIFRQGQRLGLPLEATWSCYAGGPIPCGQCESCRRRQRAELRSETMRKTR